ncbi:heterokaryon incompatibility [Fusarium beomiforme]|uniref:Heterokaryon incompatibility n=1 Tax=Fusarium beomiforme TaxID=44412 RepID=A0A9P5AIK6_9HYPO|nr:heterokaryon incompatibility [Fusarium beomiforme]
METSVKYKENLCPICRDILLVRTSDASKGWVRATGQTFQIFREAVENKCIICSVPWYLSRQYRHLWAESPELWEPMDFKAHIDSGEENIIKLHILYNNPLKNQTTEAKFRLISTNDVEYHQNFDFPALETTVSQTSQLTTGLQWLTNCRSYHPRCRELRLLAKSWLPTRLLDIGDEASQYMTLSYRWGPDPHIRLLSSNIASFRQGQPIDNLPVLFRDIIKVSHHFSIRYLWIDSLCIIQDSKEDWEKESSAMQYVYSNSACNLAASASESPDSRLTHKRNLDFIRPGKVQSALFSDRPRDFYIYDKTYWNRQIFDGPLHNRGWVFQERFLSPRVLYFGKHQLLWECRTRHRCEVFPEGIPSHWSDKEMDSLMEHQSGTNPVPANRMTLGTFNLWSDIVQQYSRCDLTKPSDKLHAIAGIAKLFEEFTGDEYVAGLWKSYFTAMLDWRVFDPKSRASAGYRAPSWSWASVDSPVWTFGLSARAEFLVHLAKLLIKTRTSDRMSAILGASAVLKARVIPAVCQSIRMPFSTFQAPAGKFKVQIHPDTSDMKFTDGDKISYMPLKLDYRYGRSGERIPYVVCLMLEENVQSPELQSQYRRLGCFVLMQEYGNEISSLCFGSEIKEVEII